VTSTPQGEAARTTRGLRPAPSLIVRALLFGAVLAALAALGDGALARLPSWASVPSSVALEAGATVIEPPPPIPPPVPVDAGAASTSASTTGGATLDLNSATVEDLRRLPRVGPKRAQAILDLRARMGGRFRRVEDLLRVRGVGRSTLTKLRPLVRVDAARDLGDGGGL